LPVGVAGSADWKTLAANCLLSNAPEVIVVHIDGEFNNPICKIKMMETLHKI